MQNWEGAFIIYQIIFYLQASVHSKFLKAI